MKKILMNYIDSIEKYYHDNSICFIAKNNTEYKNVIKHIEHDYNIKECYIIDGWKIDQICHIDKKNQYYFSNDYELIIIKNCDLINAGQSGCSFKELIDKIASNGNYNPFIDFEYKNRKNYHLEMFKDNYEIIHYDELLFKDKENPVVNIYFKTHNKKYSVSFDYNEKVVNISSLDYSIRDEDEYYEMPMLEKIHSSKMNAEDYKNIIGKYCI